LCRQYFFDAASFHRIMRRFGCIMQARARCSLNRCQTAARRGAISSDAKIACDCLCGIAISNHVPLFAAEVFQLKQVSISDCAEEIPEGISFFIL